jgi:UDP-2,3-diacylglucosamine hydrolase
VSRALEGDMVIVADVHLAPNDPEVALFTAFLEEAAPRAEVIVLLGDIFALWLGAPKYTLPHHRRVLDCCRALRRGGTEVVFVEGNREFDAGGWQGDAFDAVGQRWTTRDWAGRHWLLAHGDVIDPEDTGNRVFRRIVRSAAVLALFRRLPKAWGLRFAHWLERRLRHRNLPRKTRIDETKLERYAGWLGERGFDAGAIGHLHVELWREFADAAGGPRALHVLPDWRSTHRYLRVDAGGRSAFETWRRAPASGPAIVEVREEGGRARLRLEDPDAAPPAGTPVAVSGGHGPDVRGGRVAAVSGEGWVTLELEPGPPLQVGDRVLRSESHDREPREPQP